MSWLEYSEPGYFDNDDLAARNEAKVTAKKPSLEDYDSEVIEPNDILS